MKGYSVVSREEALVNAVLNKTPKHYGELFDAADKYAKKAIKVNIKDVNLSSLRLVANVRAKGNNKKYKVLQNCNNIYILKTN